MAKTFFADGDVTTKTGGARVLAAWLNKVFAHRHDGLDQDGSAPLDYAVAAGAVNTLTAALAPTLTALVVGMPFGIKVNLTNTGAVTLNLNALGALPLHKLGGQELVAGDIQANQIIRVAYDGVGFQLLSYNSPPVTDATTLQGQGAAMLAPPGAKGEFFMPSVPTGWLLCDGRVVLRAQYPALFTAIGTTWGAGDNVSTFNLPEVRGEFFRAWDNGRGVDVDRQFGIWQADELKAHTHSAVGGITSDPRFQSEPGAGASTGAITSGSTGGAETRTRNIAVLVCIKY